MTDATRKSDIKQVYSILVVSDLVQEVPLPHGR